MITALAQALTATSTTAKHIVGQMADVQGKVYVYSVGVASGAAGAWVTVDEVAQTALLGAASKGRVGIMMSVLTASLYGWVQVYGKTVTALAATGFADNGDIYATATPGTIDDAVVAGDRVIGAIGRSAVAGGVITAELNYPHIDQIAD